MEPDTRKFKQIMVDDNPQIESTCRYLNLNYSTYRTCACKCLLDRDNRECEGKCSKYKKYRWIDYLKANWTTVAFVVFCVIWITSLIFLHS